MSSLKLTNAQLVLTNPGGFLFDVLEYDEINDDYSLLTRIFGIGDLQEAVNNAIDQLMQESLIDSHDDINTEDCF